MGKNRGNLITGYARRLLIIILSAGSFYSCYGKVNQQSGSDNAAEKGRVVVGAERMEEYLPYIENRKVALVVNHTSIVEGRHLVDTLNKREVNIVRIFAPEHGFRGLASAGETIRNEIDEATGIPVISLYGNKKKPLPEDLTEIEVIVFDIQDVGVRFYTYISTLELVMEAAAENGVDFIILDRPNPHINYTGGPVLEQNFRSFVGQQRIPIVYGLSIGEYGAMLKGEKLFAEAAKLNLRIVHCENYTRATYYALPVPPSPNLPNMTSVLLYPLLCLLEGTDFSEGRGTDLPFQQYGHPEYSKKEYSFTPEELLHAKNPKWLNKKCYGVNLSGMDPREMFNNPVFHLDYVLDAFQHSDSPSTFFKNTSFFDKLAGTDQIRKDILKGLSSSEMIEKWRSGIAEFMAVSRKYYFYPAT